jgi:hypothetical protein
MYALPRPAPNQQVAQQQTQGAQQLTGYAGDGRILINGEPTARGGTGSVVVVGARPGVDGTYIIKTAEHVYSRQGYLTWLDVFVNIGASSNNVGDSGFAST